VRGLLNLGERALLVVGLDVVMVALDGGGDQVQARDQARVKSAARKKSDAHARYPVTDAASCPGNVAARP
jgi:hypothetical protein